MKHKVLLRQPCCTGWSYWVSALLTQSPGDTVQTGTGKVDPARKFKCTTAARAGYKLVCILFYKSMLCMLPMQPYINLYVFLILVYASYAAIHKLVCIFLYTSMLCMHPMQPYINLCVFSYLSLCYACILCNRI